MTEPLNDQPGTVIRSTGSFYRVRMAGGEVLDCTLKGKLRLDELKTTNPIAVGDRVVVGTEGAAPVIRTVLPRNNYILRRSTRLSAQVQMLCANIDQALLMATVVFPFTPLGYIDRFLVMAEAYHIPVTLVFNKVDLVVKPKDEEKLLDCQATYEAIGYRVVLLSALDPVCQAVAQKLFRGKVSFIAGLSGAGKSSLVNLADHSLNLKVGVVSEHSEKGKHTTTYAEMHSLTFAGQHAGFVIDAPGFKEFDIVGITHSELSHYFPEMRALLAGCRFNNCTHTSEPGCAIRTGVEEGAIAETRYHTYLSMLASIPANEFQK